MDAARMPCSRATARPTPTLDAIKNNLSQKRDPLWLVVSGRDESEVARKLDAVLPVLNAAVSNQTLSGFTCPARSGRGPNFKRPIA